MIYMKDKYIECKVCFEKIKINPDCDSIICSHCKTNYTLIPRSGTSEILIMILISIILDLFFDGVFLILIDLLIFVAYLFYIVKNPYHIKLIN